MSDIVLGITLRGDGRDANAAIRGSRQELQRLKETTDQGNVANRRWSTSAVRLGERTRQLGRGYGELRRQVDLVRLATLALATISAGRLATSFVSAASETENLRVRLRFLTGDANAAAKAVLDFAAKVPFTFQEIQQAAPVLLTVARDLDEFRQLLEISGDVSAVSGLSFLETAQNMQRAFSSGIASAELFRERGVTAMLGFQAGVTISAEETRDRILKLWKDSSFALVGASAEMAKTWTGLTSMLSDKWFAFRNQVMDAEPFDFLKAAAAELDSELNANFDSIGDAAGDMGRGLVDMAEDVAIAIAVALDEIQPLIDAANDVGDFLDRVNRATTRAGEWLARGGAMAVGPPLLQDPFADAVGSAPGSNEAAMRERLARIRARMEGTRTDDAAGGRGRPDAAAIAGGSQSIGLPDTGSHAAAGSFRAAQDEARDANFASVVAEGRFGAGEEAAKSHADAVKEIAKAYRDTLPPLDAAVAEANAWRTEALKGLDETAAGYDDFARQVEAVYQDKIKDAYEQNLEDSTRWSDGAIRALKDYADEAADAAAGVERAFTRGFGGMEDAVVRFSKTGKVSVADLADSVIEDLIRIQVRSQITGPLSAALGDALSGAFSSGAGPALQTGDFAGAFNSANADILHAGGVVGGPGMRRRVPAELFAGARRYHRGGLVLAPDEVPAIMRQGETVRTPEQEAALRQPQEIVLRVIDGDGREVPTRQRRDGEGKLNVELQLDNMVAKLGRRRGSETRRMLEDLGAGAGLKSV